jgi:hypothetical protein
MNRSHRPLLVTWLCVAALSACGDDADTGAAGSGGSDAPDAGGSGSGGAGGEGGGGGSGGATCEPRDPSDTPDPGTCEAAATDYAPCTDDGWDACISDDGEYHSIEATISTIARVEAFEAISDLLFDPTRDPTSDDFLAARLLYQEEEGLDSRVVRRYDPHFDVPDGTDCTLPDAPAMEPDYCVGPAKLQPILLDAFNAGIMGEDPRGQAGRIEGALLWFLYVSTAKESLTCTEVAKDCDSAYAYYTGGAKAPGGIALARRVREVDVYAHDRAWDGLLAVRCWRDLDDAEVATDAALRDRARAQYDRAVLDGVAAIVRDALERTADTTAAAQSYHWRLAATLGQALDRAMREHSVAMADALADALAGEAAAAADLDGAIAAIDAVFDCP